MPLYRALCRTACVGPWLEVCHAMEATDIALADLRFSDRRKSANQLTTVYSLSNFMRYCFSALRNLCGCTREGEHFIIPLQKKRDKMKQSEVRPPAVIGNSERTYVSALRLHLGASILRNLVWLMTGDGSDFDQTIFIATPGLGSGHVRCAVCLPASKQYTTDGHLLPLLLVMEGGGFILGQPEDGQKHCRKLADEVSGTNLLASLPR